MFSRTEFGSRLRTLRKGTGEKQNVLAELLDVSIAQISELESGKKSTTFERLVLLCEHYNVCSDYLLGLTDEARPLK